MSTTLSDEVALGASPRGWTAPSAPAVPLDPPLLEAVREYVDLAARAEAPLALLLVVPMIRRTIAVAGTPVMVTENGIAADDDTRRIEYVRRALEGVASCLGDGLDVRGYIYWSAMDNYEWMFGYRPTFGLIAVDRQTQVRTVKPSARWLGSIARAGAV